jgi:tetratricopeptide (TPR) repeat protein
MVAKLINGYAIFGGLTVALVAFIALMKRAVRLPFLWFALASLSPGLCLAAEKPWMEVRSPHFRVLTDGREKDARRVAREFEQMRSVFAVRFPTFRLDTAAPLLIFAVRDEESAKNLFPAMWRGKDRKVSGYYQQSWEKQYAMVRLDQDQPGSFQVVYHEYIHSIIHMNSRWLPTWMDEGLAEFFGSSRFEGDKVFLGYPSSRLPYVQGQALIPIDKLIAVNEASPYYRDEDKVQKFYAESWALIHFMQFGDGMERGAKMDRFLTLLDQGVDQPKAFAQVFGDSKKMDAALRFYLTGLTLAGVTMRDLPKFEDKDFANRVLTAAETEAELGGYHLSVGDRSNARALIEQALKDDLKLGIAHEYMGMLNFNEGKDEDADADFSQAYQIDPTLYLSLFFKTMLSPAAQPGFVGDRGELYTSLLKVLAIRSEFAPVYVQLAFYHLRNGNLTNALLMAKKAQHAEPSRAGYYSLIGHILQLMGKQEDAATIRAT